MGRPVFSMVTEHEDTDQETQYAVVEVTDYTTGKTRHCLDQYSPNGTFIQQVGYTNVPTEVSPDNWKRLDHWVHITRQDENLVNRIVIKAKRGG